jgi:hypothetical protein
MYISVGSHPPYYPIYTPVGSHPPYYPIYILHYNYIYPHKGEPGGIWWRMGRRVVGTGEWVPSADSVDSAVDPYIA